MSFSNWQKKAGEASDKVFETIGYAISSDYDGKYKKVIGGAQGPIGHWMNKKMDCDPISDCQSDCEELVREGIEKLKK